ncbi:orotidine-5'-phosphate decarboxylase [Treponema sp.]|uniref:orotidine-5'-phosphate decarboxylase n=1 Tax=Treponema sp. TaxID=166 RepID=UPI00298DA18A|nr:orotidine-5'-phosphate decarboxylase [Treponema sp.]MCR5614228.1 orotidine-5'-phosphate decarboxylase [Treponema sp.]
MKHAMQKLQEAAKQFGPLCVGLDTDPSYIPENILAKYESPAAAVLDYNLALIERIKTDKSACCFKIQIAYYEAMGLKGMEVYAKTVKAVRDAGFVAISDIKRGDIAATAGAYARAHFAGDFETDIITINPYMGFDTLKPFTEYCAAGKGAKGAFVLLRTSNPGMVDIEQQELKSGGRVLDKVGSELNSIKEEFKNEYQEQTCGPVGAVVGCTEESDARALRDAYPEIFFLIPGYGAQGGAAKICAILLEKCGGTVNSSRGILCAWKKDSSLEEKRNNGTLTMEDIINASAKAALDSKKELTSF